MERPRLGAAFHAGVMRTAESFKPACPTFSPELVGWDLPRHLGEGHFQVHCTGDSTMPMWRRLLRCAWGRVWVCGDEARACPHWWARAIGTAVFSTKGHLVPNLELQAISFSTEKTPKPSFPRLHASAPTSPGMECGWTERLFQSDYLAYICGPPPARTGMSSLAAGVNWAQKKRKKTRKSS